MKDDIIAKIEKMIPLKLDPPSKIGWIRKDEVLELLKGDMDENR